MTRIIKELCRITQCHNYLNETHAIEQTTLFAFLTGFYARQLYRQVLLRARISYGNSVRPSVLVPRPGTESSPGETDSGFSPYGSPGCLVSDEVFWCRWVRRFPSNEGIKEGYPLRNRNFTTIGSSSMRTVADRHRPVAYHNKHC